MTTLANKIVTIVLGLLTLPFFVVLALFVFVVSAVLLCPGVTAMPVDCQDCGSDWCLVALAIVIFLALPLFVVSAYVFARRKARHRGSSH